MLFRAACLLLVRDRMFRDRSSTSQQAVAWQKVGRNDPCPCGSGKKYKKGHGS